MSKHRAPIRTRRAVPATAGPGRHTADHLAGRAPVAVLVALFLALAVFVALGIASGATGPAESPADPAPAVADVPVSCGDYCGTDHPTA